MDLPMLYIIAALDVVLLALAVILLIRQGKTGAGAAGNGGDLETRLALIDRQLAALAGNLSAEFERGRRESGLFQKDIREETAQSLKTMAERLSEMRIDNIEHRRQLTETVGASLNAIQTNNMEQNERQNRMISEAVARMQDGNEKKLEQMRATVDEKLTTTLSARLDSSFTAVSAQLESVNKSLGEMKELSDGVTANVTALNRVLTNVKARGTWAEVQLESILDQTIPNMYERNFATKAGSGERVEFAVKIPSGAESKETLYLPIDSKFPMENYIRLCDAADNADQSALQSTRKALETDILNEAKTISKYINVPVTTPFAIMYLATEGLYAEIASSRSGLPERLQSEFGVMTAGPSTITALLNSLSMGFKAVAINDKANEVRELLSAAKAQYDKFGVLLDKAKQKVEDAGRSLSEAQDRNRIIQGKLKSVDRIDYGAADDILGISSGAQEEALATAQAE